MFGLGVRAASAADPPTIAFVPLDDRPVTLQLPVALGAIAGQPVIVPPAIALGRYLQPGDPEAISRWLASSDLANASALVASTDMVCYGGLVASRIPGIPAYDAYYKLRQLAAFKAAHPAAFSGVFGTIMRLAPTGVPKLGAAVDYYATGTTVDLIQQYANLPDPPKTAEQIALAARLRERIGAPLDAYLATRRRNLEVDEFALQIAAEGGFDRIVIGQDDAGPTGLHLKDVAALDRDVVAFGLGARASIEPGADELGMAMLARAIARNAAWTPSVRVIYSRTDIATFNDQLEYVPIDVTIGKLIGATGGVRANDARADIDLFVRVPGTSDVDEKSFENAIADAVAAKRGTAVADITFLRGGPGPEQRALVDALVARGIAGKLDAFASWNTNANTVGTALGAAIAVGAGRRTHRLDERAHAQFMLDRYIDDYAFHQFVRPALNDAFRKRGFDTTLLVPPISDEAQSMNRAMLWPYALDLLGKIYPNARDLGLIITLPWDRTFETKIDVRLGFASGER
jgi:hypothetical protein